MIVGMLLLLLLSVNTRTLIASALTLVIGLGMGFLMQNTMLITQNSAELRDMGAATGSVTLFRTVGGSLGVALLGSIYTTQLTNTLTARLGARRRTGWSAAAAPIPPSVVLRLPAPVRDAFQSGVVSGLHGTLIGGAAMARWRFVVAWFIKAVPLRGSAPTAPVVEPVLDALPVD